METTDLKAAIRNGRTHSKRQIAQIATCVRRVGFTNPVLVDDDNRIIAGHGRVAEAREIGMRSVPCIRLSHMSDTEKRAYILTDNKLALNAGWDMEIVAIELQGLLDEGFDLFLTGFEMPEVDFILTEAGQASSELTGPEDICPPPSSIAVSRLGDHWLMGRHALYCGDAKDPAALKHLMGDSRADMVFTDAPYNLKVDGHVSGLGKTHHREFAEASGEMSQNEFTQFLWQLKKVSDRRRCCAIQPTLRSV